MKKIALVLTILFSTSTLAVSEELSPVKKIGTNDKQNTIVKEDTSLELSETVNPYTGVRASIEKKNS